MTELVIYIVTYHDPKDESWTVERVLTSRDEAEQYVYDEQPEWRKMNYSITKRTVDTTAHDKEVLARSVARVAPVLREVVRFLPITVGEMESIFYAIREEGA